MPHGIQRCVAALSVTTAIIAGPAAGPAAQLSAGRALDGQAGAAQTALPTAHDLLDGLDQSARDFPPHDRQLWTYDAEPGIAWALADEMRARFPDALETLEVLVRAGRASDALRVADTIVTTRPADIRPVARLLATRWQALRSRGIVRDRDDDLRTLITVARAGLAGVPRDDAARATFDLLSLELALDPEGYRKRLLRLQQLVADYPGTAAALDAEVDAVSLRFPRDPRAQAAALDALIESHPGTCGTARALYQKAITTRSGALEPGADPTSRLLETLALVRVLQQPAYQGCASPYGRPDSLLTGVSRHKAVYAPGNTGRLIAAYRQYVTDHFAVDETYPVGNGVGWIITGLMGEWLALEGDGPGGMERLFDELERVVADRAGVRFMRAHYFIERSRQPIERARVLSKAKAALLTVIADGSERYAREALAELAWLHLHHREYRDAHARFREYLERYPTSGYAWAATLRAGQCLAKQELWAEAAATFQTAARDFAKVPLARVAGHAYAGRALEAAALFDRALTEYRAAHAEWGREADGASVGRRGGPRYTFPIQLVRIDPTPATLMDVAAATNDTLVDEGDLLARVLQFERSLASPGGADVLRARWLLERGRRAEAAAIARRVVTTHPRSPNATSARLIGHMAQVGDALELAKADSPASDDAAALRALDDVLREPFDFGVCAAAISRSVLLAKRGDRTGAERLLADALARWQRYTEEHRSSEPASDVERDLVAIRDLVFRPAGDGPYAGTRWNGFRWPTARTPFVVSAPEIDVAFADGRTMRAALYHAGSHDGRALFFTADEIRFFGALMTTIGGTKTRPTDAMSMEVPHQPVGASVDVQAFLSTAFTVMPGHWGGWELYTFPRIDRVEFLDADRTRVRVSITVGYGGGDASLEKKDGAWRVTSVIRTWLM